MVSCNFQVGGGACASFKLDYAAASRPINP
jgi:hypothetical protein